MRKRSFATAVVCVLPLFSVPTAGSAQSVLERVLGQVENSTNLAPVNGVYANIAENVSDFLPQSNLSIPYTLNDWTPDTDFPGLTDDVPALYRIIGERDGQPGVLFGRWVEVTDIGTVIDGNITDFADSFVIGENGSITVQDLNGVSDT
jgi:hypothetical protein